jgi:CBS domain-containing protein
VFHTPDGRLCHRGRVSGHPAPQPASEEGYGLPTGEPEDAAGLRHALLAHLREQGFVLTDKGLLMHVPRDKDAVRRLHEHAVAERRESARPALARHEDALLRRLLPSAHLDVAAVRPALRLVDTYRHPDAALWRWASLHWSIPVSAGYGRRLRFVVVDEGHGGALMGLIGLGDPVFAMSSRDRWVGWDHQRRRTALSDVMDAFVLGAVPPYQDVLAGKLVAMLAVSTEVRDAFRAKFRDRTSLISDREPDARLALVTTTSALGRSSVYNRLRRPDGLLAFEPIGVTAGSGDFHLSGVIYDRLVRFATLSDPERGTHRHERWPGKTFRNRREVVIRALGELGLPERQMRTHGIQRQVFAAPTAHNSRAYLRGEEDTLDDLTLSVDETSAHWRARWAVPRAERIPPGRFRPEDWRLWPA